MLIDLMNILLNIQKEITINNYISIFIDPAGLGIQADAMINGKMYRYQEIWTYEKIVKIRDENLLIEPFIEKANKEFNQRTKP